MNVSIRIGLAVALLAAAMGHSPAARAEALPGYACDETTYGAYEWTSETTPAGAFYYFYVCTEYGWTMYGMTYCDNFGNCSSD